MTRDIDFVIELGEADVPRIVALFDQDCFIDPESVHRAVVAQGMFNIIHNGWIVKADFVVKRDEAYRNTEFERRRTIEINGHPVVFVSPEDLILSKLWWGKESHSEMQERDVGDLLDVVEDLDLDYLRRWAFELGVGDDLDRLRNS